MAGLCWLTVMLAFFLSAENSLAAVDQNRLERIVDGILGEYRTDCMFSLAVSIPENQNQDIDQILQQVFRCDPGDNVKNKINNDEVYIGSRVVAAKVLKRTNKPDDHAESRVLDHLNQLFESGGANNHDMLLFCVYASPCVERRVENSKNILTRIHNIRRWNTYAVVFFKVFNGKNCWTNRNHQRRGALQRLGTSIGLDNIFRCDIKNGRMQCTSCSIGTQVAHYCVSDDTSSIQLQQSNENGNFGQSGSEREVGVGREVSWPRWEKGRGVTWCRLRKGRRVCGYRWGKGSVRLRGRGKWRRVCSCRWATGRGVSWHRWGKVRVSGPRWGKWRRVCSCRWVKGRGVSWPMWGKGRVNWRRRGKWRKVSWCRWRKGRRVCRYRWRKGRVRWRGRGKWRRVCSCRWATSRGVSWHRQGKGRVSWPRWGKWRRVCSCRWVKGRGVSWPRWGKGRVSWPRWGKWRRVCSCRWVKGRGMGKRQRSELAQIGKRQSELAQMGKVEKSVLMQMGERKTSELAQMGKR
ncbi:uncharacterized protein LOC122976643 [Thunnus albacares]|uniref:uncharacterized protein LOC122976643 n=1 Tax=Thunnus albacares TaxID=8236 RepID=UPI001CF62F55|nr:uncharacterized protein LOC122976643 [Thunnus albacares]